MDENQIVQNLLDRLEERVAKAEARMDAIEESVQLITRG